MLHESQIPTAVGLLPLPARAILSMGPIASSASKTLRCRCRVCEAGEVALAVVPGDHPEARRIENLVVSLDRFHHGMDLWGAGLISHPGEGPLVFERCLRIYEAAGWRGPVTAVVGPHEAVRRCSPPHRLDLAAITQLSSGHARDHEHP